MDQYVTKGDGAKLKTWVVGLLPVVGLKGVGPLGRLRRLDKPRERCVNPPECVE